jgi:hypothetical protein
MDWENMLASYEISADDESAAWEQRLLSARKANWLRVISRLQATGRKVRGLHDLESSRSVNEDDAESRLFSPVRLRGNVREFADETCRKLMNQQRQPEYVGARKPRLLSLSTWLNTSARNRPLA